MNCQTPPAPTRERGRALEAALDHREVEQIARQPVARQHLVEQLAVASRAPQPVRHHRASLGIVLEVVEVAQHLRVPAHREVGQLERAQPVGVGRRRRGCCRRRGAGERSSGGTSPLPPQLPGQRGRGQRGVAAGAAAARRVRGNACSSKRRSSRSSGVSGVATSSTGTPRTARRSERLSSPGSRVVARLRAACRSRPRRAAAAAVASAAAPANTTSRRPTARVLSRSRSSRC